MKTMIKNIKLGVLCCMGLLSAVACSDFLDVEPQTALNAKTFFKTSDNLKSACNFFYTTLPPHLYAEGELWADHAYGTGANGVSSATRIAAAGDATWNSYFLYLFQANNVLENSTLVTGTAKDINRYRSEALFFRAWVYYEMVRRYGDVPWINQTLDPQNPLTYGPRIDRKIIVDSILTDLDNAAAGLPKPSEMTVAEYGRFTKTAALAFKSRVALFEGTRQKFHSVNGGNANKYLTAAKQAAKEVMDLNEHSLYTTGGADAYRQLFLLTGANRRAPEKILSSLYGENAGNSLRYSVLSRNLEQAGLTPTRALVDTYLFTDGLPLGKTTKHFNETDSIDAVFVNRDPRLSMMVFRKGDAFRGGQAYNPPNEVSTITGYHQKKYYDDAAWTPNQNFNDLILIRYAEVLLNYAEATFELTDNISDADLDLSINKLRDRAIFPIKLTNSFVTANGLTMRNEIRRERSVELAGEGFRYFDLIRWKTAETELIKPVEGRINFVAGAATVRKVAQPASGRKFSASRDYLFPLPTLQLDLLRKDDTDPNKTWVQNPNW